MVNIDNTEGQPAVFTVLLSKVTLIKTTFTISFVAAVSKERDTHRLVYRFFEADISSAVLISLVETLKQSYDDSRLFSSDDEGNSSSCTILDYST